MTAFKNLIHGVLLAGWAVLGVAVTFKALFVSCGMSLAMAGGFWLWLLAFTAVTTTFAAKLKSPLALVGAHAALLIFLGILPRLFPLTLLRYGLDVVRFL